MPQLMHSDSRTISSKETTGGKDRFYERYYINNFFYKSYFSKNGLNICKKSAISIYLNHIIWKKKYDNATIVQDGTSLGIKLSNNKLVNKNNLGFGQRSWRYAVLVNNCEIVESFIEKGFEDDCDDDPYEASSPQNILNFLKDHKKQAV